MKLAFVQRLIDRFGPGIVRGESFDKATIFALFTPHSFPKCPYLTNKNVNLADDLTDKNYSMLEAIAVFILGLSRFPGMTDPLLSLFVRNMIDALPDQLPGDQSPSIISQLIRSFLGYLSTKAYDVAPLKALLVAKVNLNTPRGTLTSDKVLRRLNTDIMLRAWDFKTPLSSRLALALEPDISTLIEEKSIEPEEIHSLNVSKKDSFRKMTMKSLRHSIDNSVHRQELINALSIFKAHYSNPATQAHQSVFHPEKITQSNPPTTQAAGKAGVASDLIKALESFTNMPEIPYIFINSLKSHGLTFDGDADPSQFFVGTKSKVQLSKEVERFLSSQMQTETAPLIPVISHDEESDKTTEKNNRTLTTSPDGITLNPLTTVAVLNPSISSSSSSLFNTTSSETPENSLLSSLQGFYAHYSSRINQLHESVRYFGQKDTAPKKAQVALGLIEFISQRDTSKSIHSKFEDLLTSNGITSEQFFDGNTKKYLTEENIALLKNAGASAIIEL